MPHGLHVVDILGVPVVRATTSEALDAIETLAQGSEPSLIAYANAHTLNLAASDPSYLAILRSAALVLNDGAGIALAARAFNSRFPENLNGSDFNPAILRLAARNDWRVYFLGGEPGVAQEAASRLAAGIAGLRIAGVQDGFFPRSKDAEVAELVARSRADVIMVAMGNPLQERWLAANLASTGARLGIGVGAFFDFTAERQKRAPAWMNRAGIEWVWRLSHDPKRLWRRYVLGNPRFLARVARQRLKGD